MRFNERTFNERTGGGALDVGELITCDVEIMSGTPVFKNTRVPIKNLIDYLGTGESLDEFLEDFPSVTREQAVQTLELAKEILFLHAYSSEDNPLCHIQTIS